ncbi:MAG: hypothetical protein GXP10_01165 [Gammaproteobacteria bacterium]|nr:hypothetical protein [Gammaproteobacteria bacterium]
MKINHQQAAIQTNLAAQKILAQAHNALLNGDFRSYASHCKRLHVELMSANTHAILAVTAIKQRRKAQHAAECSPQSLTQNSATH